MIITSKENQLIKNIKKLKEKKYRETEFIIEGEKMINEALQENVEVECIVVSEDFNFRTNLKERILKENFKFYEVSKNIFKDLTDVKTPQGIIAVVKKNIENSKIDFKANYILALDGVQDPGNIGTIIRTLDAANLKQIIVSKNTADCFSPKVIRSTMGSIFRVNVVEVDNLKETLDKAKKENFQVITTALDAKNSIYDIDYNKKVVVIGNEANGVSKEIQDISDIKVKIPMPGKAESLNASVAAGIMIYEYVRGGKNV